MNDFKKWNSKEYLKQYYSLDYLVYDEIIIFKFLISFLKKEGRRFSSMLDFGAGPTIHRLIPFVPYVNDIYITDYLKSNLKEIDIWIKSKPKSHDWSKQIRHILTLENKKLKDVKLDHFLKNRTETLKNKIISLSKCDIFKINPTSLNKKFPLVTSFYCIDSMTKSKKEWKILMNNLLSLVEPNGWIVISALRKTTKYKVGNLYFPSPNIDENDFKSIFLKNNFDKKSISVKIIPADIWANEGINSLIILRARKKYENFSRKN